MSDFYVYALLDQRRPGRFEYPCASFLFEPFYVGKGRGRRVLKHRWDMRQDHRSRRITAIRAEAGQWPLFIILHSEMSEGAAFAEERELIRAIGRRANGAGPLTNLTDGGRGGSAGRPMSAETKRKISAANLGRERATGWCHSEEAKQKMRGPKSAEQISNMKAARAGRPPVSEEVHRKISAALTGRKPAPATLVKLKGRIPWNKRIGLQPTS